MPYAHVAGIERKVYRSSQVVAGLVVAILVSACTVDPVEPMAVTEIALPTAQTPGEVQVGACVDTSGSVMPTLAQDGIEAIAAAVEEWGAHVGAPEDGITAVPPLAIAVRKVLDNSSLHPSGEVASGTLPGIPGAMARPDLSLPDAVALSAEHRRQVADAEEGQTRLRAAASALADRIRGGNWSGPKGSEIWGCLEALALTTPERPGRQFLLVSDLLQNDPRQEGLARFDGAGVSIVHQCVEAEPCARQEQTWEQNLLERGAREVNFVRPERVEDAVAQWLGAP